MVKVYKVYAKDRVCSVLWGRSSTFLLVEVFTDFSQILVVHALPQYRVKRLGMGFSDLHPGLKSEVRRESDCGFGRRRGQLVDAGSSCAPGFSWRASLARGQ